MSADAQMIRITNHTAHEVALPPIKIAHLQRDDHGNILKGDDGQPLEVIEYEHATGIRVPPGGYNIPAEYFARLAGSSKPGHKRVKALYLNKRDDGTQVLSVDPDPEAVSAPEGVPPPKTLAAYGEAQAKGLIDLEDDVAALKRWTNDKRPAVAQAAKARLAGLGGGR